MSIGFVLNVVYVHHILIWSCIHVKSPGITGRLPEIYQISWSPTWKNKSPGFVMKQNGFCVAAVNKRSSIPPFTHAHNNNNNNNNYRGYVNYMLCRLDNGSLTKQYRCALPAAFLYSVKRTIPPLSLIDVQSISTLYEFYLMYIYLLIVTIRAHYKRKKCILKQVSQIKMPTSPRASNAFVAQDHKLVRK